MNFSCGLGFAKHKRVEIFDGENACGNEITFELEFGKYLFNLFADKNKCETNGYGGIRRICLDRIFSQKWLLIVLVGSQKNMSKVCVGGEIEFSSAMYQKALNEPPSLPMSNAPKRT